MSDIGACVCVCGSHKRCYPLTVRRCEESSNYCVSIRRTGASIHVVSAALIPMCVYLYGRARDSISTTNGGSKIDLFPSARRITNPSNSIFFSHFSWLVNYSLIAEDK